MAAFALPLPWHRREVARHLASAEDKAIADSVLRLLTLLVPEVDGHGALRRADGLCVLGPQETGEAVEKSGYT